MDNLSGIDSWISVGETTRTVKTACIKRVTAKTYQRKISGSPIPSDSVEVIQ